MKVDFTKDTKPIVENVSENDTYKAVYAVIPELNGGKGEITASMLMQGGRKIMLSTVPVGGSIGIHKQSTGDDINYVISGKGIAVCNGVEEELYAGVCHICPKGSEHSIINSGREPLVLFTVVDG